MTTEDPEWTDDDLEWALAWRDDDRSRCSGCGQPKSESFAKGNDNAYEATALACHACATSSREAESWNNQDGKAHGIYISVTRREEA